MSFTFCCLQRTAECLTAFAEFYTKILLTAQCKWMPVVVHWNRNTFHILIITNSMRLQFDLIVLCLLESMLPFDCNLYKKTLLRHI